MTITPDDAALAAKKRRHRNERIAATILVLVCAAAAYALYRWNETERAALRDDQRYIPKKVQITPEIELLRQYVRIDTSRPPGIEHGARWLAAQLAVRGLKPELIESEPGYVSVYARIKGKKPGEGLLLFNHIDVVPPSNAKWNHPPFEAKIVGDELHGRGTLDMKALAVVQLLAMADVVRGGRVPEHDIAFLATAEEEQGSDRGMRWLVAHRPDLFEGIRYGITEGGITEMMSDKMTYFGVEVGGKQIVRVALRAPNPDALRRARFALEPFIRSSERPGRVLPEVREYFEAIAPSRIAFGAMLADIDAAAERGEFWKLPPSYRDMTQNTMWISGPYLHRDRWMIRTMMMNLPDEDPAKRVAWLRERVEPFGVEVEVESSEGPVPSSRRDTPLFRLLAETGRKQYRTDAGPQILYRSASDSRILRPLGIECYGVCPYPVTYFQSLTIHQPNERIGVNAFGEGVRYMREVLRSWANPAPKQ